MFTRASNKQPLEFREQLIVKFLIKSDDEITFKLSSINLNSLTNSRTFTNSLSNSFCKQVNSFGFFLKFKTKFVEVFNSKFDLHFEEELT